MADDLKNMPEKNRESSDEALRSRRKFTKTGIVGAAVVFSLANRSAWGTGYNHQHPAGCVSLLNSLDFASMAPGSDKEWKLQQCIDNSHNSHKHWHGSWGHWHEHADHDHTH